MTRINTNVASLRGLRGLNNANQLLDKSLARLSTGLKINSGKDNPSGLIASEALRSQITTIEQSVRNSNRANNVIGTADSALGEVSGLLNQVRGLIQEGLNAGALSQPEIEANQLQIDAALSAINRISANTTFAGDKLIDGSKAFRTQQTTSDAAKLDDFQINGAVFAGSSGKITIDASITTIASKAELTYNSLRGGLVSDTTIEISGNKGTDVVFLGQTSTTTNVATAINSLTDVTGITASRTAATAAQTTANTVGTTNAGLTFKDARVSAGEDSGSGPKDIKITYTAGSGQALTVTSTETSSSIAISVTLGTGTTGTISSTAANVKTAIDSLTALNSVVSVTVTGDGSATSGAEAQFTVGATSGAGGTFTAGVNASLLFSSSAFGSAQFVGVNVLNGAFITLNSSSAMVDRDTGTDISARINGQLAQGKGLKATLTTAQLDATVTFTSAANTTGNSSKITVTGGGSLFQIGQEVSAAGQIGIGIEAVNTARLGGVSGKLFELGSGGGKALTDVSPTVPGAGLVSIVEEAISRVATLRGRLGAIQKNIIDTNIATLNVALENIADARSQIIDTDFAEETANLTRAQILSQAGLSVLSIANQNPSQVLSLLG